MAEDMLTITMKLAKPRENDLEQAYELAGILESFSDGFFPEETPRRVAIMSQGEAGVAAGEEFDDQRRHHLIAFYRLVMDAYKRGHLWRVLGAVDGLMNPDNNLLDPDKDHIALHPRFIESDKLGEKDAELADFAKRAGDMGEGFELSVRREEDGDLIVSILPEGHRFSPQQVQFCTPGTGGGRSPAVHAALLQLWRALQQDNDGRFPL